MPNSPIPMAICFDLFETLITEYIEDYQPTPPLSERLQLDEEGLTSAWRNLVPARFRGEIADYPATMRLICQQLGSEIDENLLAQLHAERTAQKAIPFAKINPHVLTMLTKLKEQGIKLALVSNASIEEVTAWESCALAPFFEATIFSFQVGWIKPEAEIYALACNALQVEPNATLFVGDGGSDELIGAQQARLTPLWATWFLDAWPVAKPRPNSAQFSQLTTPNALLQVVDVMRGNSLHE